MIGVLFGVAIALNFYRARFWCRYICPLGALLGIAGKNPLVRLHKSPDACDNCRLCLADCQGGANLPDSLEWKPAECFYCFNCQSDCPSQAVTFSVGTSFLKPPKDSHLDLGRRQLLASGVAGVGGRSCSARIHWPASAPTTPSWCAHRERSAKRNSSRSASAAASA